VRLAVAQAKKTEEDAQNQLQEAAKVAKEAAATAAAEASTRGAEMEKNMKELLEEQRKSFEEDQAQKKVAWDEERKILEDTIQELRGKLMGAAEANRRQSMTPQLEKSQKGGGMDDAKKKSRKKGSVLGEIDLDEESGVPIGEQLRQALAANAGRVLDLFREWDADGSGTIDKKEFRESMKRMGLEVPVKDMDALFDSWDPDGGGTLDFKEVQKALRATPAAPALKESLKRAATLEKAAKAFGDSGKKEEVDGAELTRKGSVKEGGKKSIAEAAIAAKKGEGAKVGERKKSSKV